MIPSNSSGENNGAASLFDLLLSDLGNKLGLDHNGLVLRQNALSENLKVPELRDVDERRLVLLGGLVLHFLRDQGPQLVDVEDRRVEFVAKLVKIAHSYLAEEPRVVFVEEDPVVVHASGVTASSRVLPVLSDSTVASADVAPLLPVLLEACCHLLFSFLSLSSVDPLQL